MTHTATEPAPAPGPADLPTGHGAVIAIPTLRERGFHGRYLHHAPGPAATVDLLRELFRTRYRSRDGVRKAARELITAHPCGWVRLGAATSRDKEIRPRRAPAPAGECYCHHPDGTPRPQLVASALEVLQDVEIHGQNWRWVPGGTPGDGTPWKITSGAVPDGIDYAYVFDGNGLTVKVRDGAKPDVGRFVSAITIPWDQAPDPGQIQAACDKIRARTPADLANEKAAEILADTARQLRAIPAHHDLVLHLLGGASRYLSVPDTHTPEAALARAAGLHPAHLPGHLHQLDRGDQVRLLQRAAHQLSPDTHHAP